MNDDFVSIDFLAKSQNLINCYQIQVINNISNTVFIGTYSKDDIPIPINQKINFDNHVLHIITHILTQEEIDAKIFKIIGIISTEKDNKYHHSLDLIVDNNNKYYLMMDDIILENVEICPSKDKIVEYIITQAFKNPYQKILFNES